MLEEQAWFIYPHKIILMHDGSIHVDSKEGRGTTFFVHLPLGNLES